MPNFSNFSGCSTGYCRYSQQCNRQDTVKHRVLSTEKRTAQKMLMICVEDSIQRMPAQAKCASSCQRYLINSVW